MYKTILQLMKTYKKNSMKFDSKKVCLVHYFESERLKWEQKSDLMDVSKKINFSEKTVKENMEEMTRTAQSIEKLEKFAMQVADIHDVKTLKGELDLDEIVKKSMTAAKSSVLYNDVLLMRKKLSRTLGLPIYSSKDMIIDAVRKLADTKTDTKFVKLYKDFFKVGKGQNEEIDMIDHLKKTYLEIDAITTQLKSIKT